MESLRQSKTVDSFDALSREWEFIQLSRQEGADVFFRGQASADWTLLPSLARCFRIGDQIVASASRVEGLEARLLETFSNRAHLCLQDQMPKDPSWNDVAWWMFMQHYTCPTRLLDWTRSFFVAAYFAVQELFESDGAIWFFDASLLRIANQQSGAELEQCSAGMAVPRSDKPAVFPIEPMTESQRSLAQRSTYTVCSDVLRDHAEVISASLKEVSQYQHVRLFRQLHRLTIPSPAKAEILARLQDIGITGGSMFPGADGLGRALREVAIIDAWTGAG